MLNYITPDEAIQLISETFTKNTKTESVPLLESVGRILAENICANEYVPSFNRSAMDGYAVIAADTVGCSEDSPISFILQEEIEMGRAASAAIQPGHCVYIPTGGNIPDGADAVVMVEYSAKNDDGTISLMKEVAPGTHYVSRGDDVYPGKIVLPQGRRIKSSDIGALAAMGCCDIPVVAKPIVGILSTGDELIARDQQPEEGQIRDVNSATIDVLVREVGGIPKFYGIIKDEFETLCSTVEKALSECDMVLLSGGSSVGLKDNTDQIIQRFGDILIQGIQAKPGKPTIVGIANDKPLIGLPGHPVSSFFNTAIFVKHTLRCMTGVTEDSYQVEATLTADVSPYKGRTAFIGAKLVYDGDKLTAIPLPAKSATISVLAGADAWFVVQKHSNGFAKGESVKLYLL